VPLVKVPELLHQLKEIRRSGYAFSRSQSMPGNVILAMPLPDGLAQTPTVIAVGGPAEHIAARRESLIALLRCKIRRIKPL
jgi:DNA-binding IclR family transcriptional regulator